MVDREKVLHGLSSCGTDYGVPNICEITECPYRENKALCIHELAHDANALIHELLQAQEPKTGHWVDQCCRDFLCSECGHKLVNNNWVRSDGYCHDDLPKYCPECGVKMERGIIQRRFVGEDKIVYPDYNKKTLDRR